MNDSEFTELIYKFRGEAASVLEFQPCIEALIDSAYCKTLDQIIHKAGTMWERKKAVASLGAMLPEERGLYMFVWRPELVIRFTAAPETESFFWVLYVGKAGKEDGKADTIKNRYLNEYSKYVGRDASCLWDSHAANKREERLARYLTLRPLEFWFLTMDNIPDILILEKKLLRILRPPLNQQYGPKMRAGKPTPAF